MRIKKTIKTVLLDGPCEFPIGKKHSSPDFDDLDDKEMVNMRRGVENALREKNSKLKKT